MNDEARLHLAEGERAGLGYTIGLPHLMLHGQAGIAVGQRAGSSLEFRDHREYQPGDDLRHVDWNAYARSDVLTVKLFREEVTPHIDLLVDSSKSMALEASQKARATRGLAAFLGAAASNAGYTCSPWRVGAEIEPIGNGSASPTLWQGLDFTSPNNPCEALSRCGHRFRARGVRVLLSDLLFESDPLAVLRQLADRAAAVVVVQVLAAADDQPTLGGNLRLVDSETGQIRELHIDESLLRRYRESLRRHQDNWHAVCRQCGAVFTVVVAEQFVTNWRLDDLVAAEVLKVN